MSALGQKQTCAVQKGMSALPPIPSHLSLVVIHVDPEEKSGERHHRIEMHTHDGLSAHSHAA